MHALNASLPYRGGDNQSVEPNHLGGSGREMGAVASMACVAQGLCEAPAVNCYML